MATTQMPIKGVFDRETGLLTGLVAPSGPELTLASGTASAAQTSYPVGSPSKEMPVLANYDFTGLTISDNSNVTYSQVADKLRADGSGRAIKMSCSANAAYARVRFNKGKDITQNASRKLSAKVYVDPTHWNYNAVRTAPNMNFLVSPNNVTSGQTASVRIGVLNNTMMPGWNFISQRFDVGAAGGYGEWVETAAGVDLPAYVSGASAVRYSYADVTLATAGDYVELEQLSIGERGIPVFMFGFDDATLVNNSVNWDVYQYLIARGVKGYIASRGIWVTPSTYANMDALYAAGFDVVFQGWNNTNWSTYNPALPTATALANAFRAEWQQCLELAAARGWSRVKAMAAYPQNGFVNELNDVLLNEFGIKSIRVARAAAVNGTPGGKALTPFINARDVGGVSWSYTSNGLPWAQAALDSGHTLMTYAHEFVAGAPSTSVQTTASEFKKLIDFAVDARDQGKALILTPTEYNAMFR